MSGEWPAKDWTRISTVLLMFPYGEQVCVKVMGSILYMMNSKFHVGHP
jgi:hypothetical protein